MSNKNHVDIKDGDMTSVLFEFEQIVDQLPSHTGLPRLKQQPEALDSVRRQLSRTMSKMQAGDESTFFFGRDTVLLIECTYDSDTYRMSINW